MNSFSHRFQVLASLEKVTAFHRDTRALKLLTPPPMVVCLNNIEPLLEGSISDFTMWLGPIPVHWVAEHHEVHEYGFRDIQIRGPFQAWEHTHKFSPITEDETEVLDYVQAQPSRHLIQGILARFMWRNLPLLFTYRAWRTKRALE